MLLELWEMICGGCDEFWEFGCHGYGRLKY